MKIRLLPESSDLAEIVLHSHFLSLGQNFLSDLGKRVDIEQYSKRLRTHAKHLVAEDEAGTLRGLISFYISPDQNLVFITHIGVSEKFRLQGVGRALMETMFQLFSAYTLKLEVTEGNEIAEKFYGTLGFGRTGISNSRLMMERRPR